MSQATNTSIAYKVRNDGGTFSIARVIHGIELDRPHFPGLTEGEAKAKVAAMNSDIQQSRNP